MQESRRRLLVTMAGAFAGIISVRPGLALQSGPPQPMPSPNAPGNQNVPGGLDGSGLTKQGRQSTVTPLAWSAIKIDTQKLYQMVVDFKSQVDQTNLAATLPLPLVKEAHQIEKLAKQIQERMKS